MKTIEVSDDMYDKLIALSNEINTQDHACTAMPYIIQVREEVKVPLVSEDACDGFIWYNADSDYRSDYDEKTIDVVKRDFEYKGVNEPEKWEEQFPDKYSMEAYLEENGYDKRYYRNDHHLTNAFFSRKSCQNHISSNKHHYQNPKDYLSHCVRNPEMELVMSFLCGLTGKDIHK